MITFVEGNLFESPAKVLVNTVNTVGAMGKGIAFEFKKIYPEMFRQYRDLCDSGKFNIGNLWVYKTSNKWILNFPTKKHWNQPSNIEIIKKGLLTFVNNYDKLEIDTIAFPPLGCGNGQLNFEFQVKPLMEQHLSKLPITIFIYPGLKINKTPEHIVPQETKRWLQSEPVSLSFDEVWDDLRHAISKDSEFRTLKTKTPFKIDINKVDIVITTNNSTRRILRNSILSFWQQLRDFGYSTRKIVPADLYNSIQYLVPIFAKLPYISTVSIAEDYSRLNNVAAVGLQFTPTNITRAAQADIFKFQ